MAPASTARATSPAHRHALHHETNETSLERTRVALATRGRWLGYATIGVASLEAVIGLLAGVTAGSVALVGYGADSVIEVAAACVALWRLRAEMPGADGAPDVPHWRAQRAHVRREHAERVSRRLVGLSFLALAAYVAGDAVHDLLTHALPHASWLGVALAMFSMLAMPLLSRAKRRVARGLRSGALEAEARQTSLCAYLSAILLGGLALHALVGWWWADPAAALAMVPIITREGIQTFRGEVCCDHCH